VILPVLHCEDVVDLPAERLVVDGVEARTAHAHDDVVTGLDELQRCDRAAVLEASQQGVDHGIGTVADPVLPKSLPGDVRGEEGTHSRMVASAERTQEVDEHDLEIV
jgi:hypothetical protein